MIAPKDATILKILENNQPARSSQGFWDFGDERELKWHRIHAYPAKFPAFITEKAVKFAESRGVRVQKVADIFCGCGTTAFEARRLNLEFWGCDINPVATLIARVKSSTFQPGRIETYLERVVKNRHRYNARTLTMDANERLRYWFDQDQLSELSRLKQSILLLPKGKYREFFLCAFSNILKPASRWLTKSIKPQIDPVKRPQKPTLLFETQVNNMLTALKELPANGKKHKIQIETRNFLGTPAETISADLIVTSPPYVTSYEYADLHQLSSMWLDYTHDFRTLRDGTIGSLYNHFDFNQDVKRLNTTGSDIVFRLFNVDKRKAAASARYFVDLYAAIEKCNKGLRPGGMALFVIGDTEYKGIRVQNSKYIEECMISIGFKEIEITKRKISKKILSPYRDARGCFSSDSSERKVYAEEFVVTGMK